MAPGIGLRAATPRGQHPVLRSKKNFVSAQKKFYRQGKFKTF